MGKNNKLKIYFESLMLKVRIFFQSHQWQFIVLIICFIFLDALSGLSYFNVILSRGVLFEFLGFISIFLFNLSAKFLIKSSLFLFLICCFTLVIFGNGKEVKQLAVLIYGLLMVGMVKEFFGYLKEKKR